MTTTRIVFTDIKLDDVLALAILQRHMASVAPNDTLVVAICGVKDFLAAATFASAILGRNTFSLCVGEMLADGKKAPQHERLGMFDSYKGVSGIVPDEPYIAPGNRVAVYLLAPCKSRMPLISTADVVYAPLGFNTRKFTLEDFASIKGELHLANNYASYSKGEGGKVTRSDEWWAPIVAAVPSIQGARENAFADTCEFIPVQTAKFGAECGVAVDQSAIRKAPFAPESIVTAFTVKTAVGPGTYMDRIVKMMQAGDVLNEITDAQQMVVWINEEMGRSGTHTKLGQSDKGPFLTFGLDEGIDAIVTTGLDVDQVNEMVRDWFK